MIKIQRGENPLFHRLDQTSHLIKKLLNEGQDIESNEVCTVHMTAKKLNFKMERHDDDGIYYVIEGIEIALVTEGETIEQALKNLREAVELYFEDDDLPELPAIEVHFEVTAAYA